MSCFVNINQMPYNNSIQSLNYRLHIIVLKAIFGCSGSFPLVAGGLGFLAALHAYKLLEKVPYYLEK